VDYRLLGPLEVCDDTGSPLRIGPLKQRAVLAALLLARGKVVSTDRLVECVWGEAAPPSAVPSLQAYVSNLRRILRGQRLERRDPGYVLAVDGGTLDVSSFLDAAAAARAATDERRWDDALAEVDAALALWRGPLLVDLQDHDWVRLEATGLEERRAECLELQVTALLGRSRIAEALARTGELVAAHPFRERATWLRLLALHRAGRTAEALEAYRAYARLVDDELGLEPGHELRELHARLLRDEPELASWPARAGGVAAPGSQRPAEDASDDEPAPAPDGGPVEVHLPTSAAPLIGRDEVLARLTALLREQRLVTVVGSAGCGKTRVAVEAARASAQSFPGGVWFVDLAAVDDPALVVDVVVSSIGFSTQTSGTSVQALQAYVQDRQLLVVLDNCEHVLAAAAEAAAIVAGARGCGVLTTSREPLGLEGETLWTLGPLGVDAPLESSEPRPALPGSTPAAPATELFAARAAAADPTLVLDGARLSLVAEICRVLDGVPLAIELAAARVRVATLEEIAEQARSDASGLRRLGRTPDERSSSVWSAIEWSHRLLSPDEQAVHRRLAVLPGRFTRQAAAAVAADLTQDGVDVPEVLAQLVHRSLLAASPAVRPGGPTLFHQLATVRSHAARTLGLAGETEAAVVRRDAWVEQLIAARPRLTEPGRNWYATVDDAYPTVRAALQRHLVEQPDATGGRILAGLGVFWYLRNLTVEGDRWLRLASTSPLIQPADAVVVRAAMAAHAYLRRDGDLGRQHVDRLFALLPAAGATNRCGLAESFAALAMAVQAQQDIDIMERLVAGIEELARAEDDSRLDLLVEAVRGLLGPEAASLGASVYERAMESGNPLAAWASARAAAGAAANPEQALVWLGRDAAAQAELGAKDAGIYAEFCAGATLAAGRPTEAVRLFAAGRTYLRRIGLAWPFLPTTTTLLVEAEKLLGASAYAAAWRSGEQQRVEDLLGTVTGTPDLPTIGLATSSSG
jgi:predicted ATPase/DNA-binding SARP family transcriptional activator